MSRPESAPIENLFSGFIAAASSKTMSIEELRDMLEQCGNLTREPGGVDYIEDEIAGTTCLWAVPQGCRADRVLIALHGGGCVTGSRFSHRKLYAHVAKAVGCRALIVDFARAPENPFPSQIQECLRTYAWLLDHGIEARHIATIGDSAGGNLATAMVLNARDDGRPLPAAILALSPWYDMEATGGSFVTNAKWDRLVTRDVSLNMSRLYLGGTSPKNPLANPLYADFRGLPPIYIQAGGSETLLDDALRAAERAKAAGVECRCEVFPRMQHVFHFMVGNAPQADEAIRKLAEWVRPKLGLASAT